MIFRKRAGGCYVIMFCRNKKAVQCLPRAVASGGASGARPPIWNRCPPFHV